MSEQESDGLAAPRSSLLTHHFSPIALTWLERLRWVAAAGQVLAVGVAWLATGLRVPLMPVAVVVSMTLLTNLGLMVLRRRKRVPPVAVPGVIVLDVALLTVLLAFTGGTDNPFSMLYLVHVALATVMLGTGAAWAVLALSGVCFATLIPWHLPLDRTAFTPGVQTAGQWVALLLIGALIVYFTARVMMALQRRERELAEAHERALRNESLTTLAAGAAHELGTPLATINVVAGELQLQTEGDVREDVTLIKSEVERCRRVIDRMRGEIAEGEALSKRHAEWSKVLEGVRNVLGEQAVRLEVMAPEAVPALRVQPRVLEQALVILIRNALDASPNGHGATLAATPLDGAVQLRVRDEGEGMTDDVLRRATEPFFTTKPPGKGMGLGLFLVRLVAERNDGTLHLDSQPGAGTTVTLTVPTAS